MTTSSAYHVERARLGAGLAELRRRAGLSGTALAKTLGWAQSKVSRIERADQTASEEDIKAWAEATGAPPDVVSELLARERAVRTEYAAWRRQLKAGNAGQRGVLLNLGAHAGRIRTLETVVVPGLLQTPEYAQYRLLGNAALHGTPPGDVTDAVRLHMQRQQILYEPGREFEFLIGEAVLRTLPCPADVMRQQLDRLGAATGMPAVQLGILPFDLPGLPWPPRHGFMIFDDQVVVETLSGEIIPQDPDELAQYFRIWDMLREVAHYGAQARALINRALERLPAAEG